MTFSGLPGPGPPGLHGDEEELADRDQGDCPAQPAGRGQPVAQDQGGGVDRRDGETGDEDLERPVDRLRRAKETLRRPHVPQPGEEGENAGPEQVCDGEQYQQHPPPSARPLDADHLARLAPLLDGT